MKLFIYILFAFYFTVLSCTKDKNPLEPSSEKEGAGKFLIQTRSNNYSLAAVNSGQSLCITAYIINKSDSIYYSHMGDRMAGMDQEYLTIGLLGQGGYIERYNTEEKSWEIINEYVFKIEGSTFVSIRPYIRYIVRGFVSPQEKVIGKCIIKIEYYDQIDPTSDMHPYVDYSNIFFIDK